LHVSVFSFHIGLFFVSFLCFRPDTENDANLHTALAWFVVCLGAPGCCYVRGQRLLDVNWPCERYFLWLIWHWIRGVDRNYM